MSNQSQIMIKTQRLVLLFFSFFLLQCNEVDELLYDNETDSNAPVLEGTQVPFVPQDVPGMLMWLDASDGQTLFEDELCSTPATSTSAPIGCWQDKSGNGKHATQSNLTRRPELSENAQNSLDAIYFADTAEQTLDVVSANWQPNQKFSAFVVYFQEADNGLGTLFSTYPSATEDFMLVSSSSATKYKYYDRNNWRYGSFYSAGDWLIDTYHRDGSRLSLYQNGIFDSQFQSLNTSSAGAARIGAYTNTGYSNLFKGHIAEIVWFTDSVTESDRLKMEGYLAHKWGKTFQLDSSHPYKVDPPTTTVPE